MEHLEAAMARGAWAEALDLALVAWRETRAPELAATIETLGPRAASQRVPPGDKAAFHAAWLALAAGRRACDLHPLLEGFARDAAPLSHRARIDLMQALPLEYSPERRMRVAEQRFQIERDRVLRERVAALRAFPLDPRISTAMLDLLRRVPWSGDDVYAPILDLVVHTGDPRAATALERLLAEPTTRKGWVRRWLAQALPPAIATLRALPFEQVAIAALSAPSPTASATSTADEVALLAEVLAAPHDDGPREVLADYLLERQDPRGEFITLQLAAARGAGTAKGLQRMGSLLRRHEAEWLGPLALVLSGREFRRGFLDAATVSINGAADDHVWESAPTDPRLRTLRVLRKGRGNEQHLSAFLLACARHPALLRAEVPTRRVLDALLALDVRSALRRLDLGIQPTKQQLTRLARADSPLADLVELSVSADLERTCAAFRQGPIPPRLRSIEVVLPPQDSLRARPAHEAYFATRLPVPTVALSAYAIRVSVTGDEALVESSWRGGVPELVHALPTGLARVTLRSHPDWPLAGPEVGDVTQLRPVLARHAREVMVEPPFA